MDDGAAPSADADVDGGSALPNLTALPDLTDMPIETLLADESVLGAVIGRVLRQMNAPAENYAAHSTST